MKACPYCAEQIQEAAVLCRFCQSSLPLPEEQTGPAPAASKTPPAGGPSQYKAPPAGSSTPAGPSHKVVFAIGAGLLIVATAVLLTVRPWASTGESGASAKGLHTVTGVLRVPAEGCAMIAQLNGAVPIAALEPRMRNGSGALIASGTMGQGTPSTNDYRFCLVPFTIFDVPEEPIYELDFSPLNGTFSKSLRELEAANWVFSLTS